MAALGGQGNHFATLIWMFSKKIEADAEIPDEIYATTGAILFSRPNVDHLWERRFSNQ